MWGISAAFAVLTIVFLAGKGGNLLAECNATCEKEQYDEKKLCYVTGGGMGIFTIISMIYAMFGDEIAFLNGCFLCIFVVIVLIMMMILFQTICRIKDTKENISDEERIRNRNKNKVIVLFSVIVIGVVGTLLVTGEVKYKITEDALEINAFCWTNYKVPYETIHKVTYRENLNIGGRTSGWGSFKLEEGNYENSEFHNYFLYSYVKCKDYVVIETGENIIVINDMNKQKTKQLYNLILEETEK